MGIKNLVVTSSQLGRLSIGRLVEKNGVPRPEKCDAIRVTSNAMVNKVFVDHPIMKIIPDVDGKIRSIPVRILFDTPENNLQTNYSCFDTKGRQVCVGDGQDAKRRSEGKMETVACPGPEYCEFAKQNRCKLYSRMIVGIDVDSEHFGYEANPTAGFVFRSTGWNSAKQLMAQLSFFSAACGGKMAGFPADLVMRAKSSSASMKSMFYYMDLVPRNGLLSAVQETAARRKLLEESGVHWNAVEKVATDGLAASVFSEDGESGQEIVAEFFSNDNEAVDPETGEILPDAAAAESVLTESDVEKIREGLQKAGRSVEYLNTWLGRNENEPLLTMGKENHEKVKKILQIELGTK